MARQFNLGSQLTKLSNHRTSSGVFAAFALCITRFCLSLSACWNICQLCLLHTTKFITIIHHQAKLAKIQFSITIRLNRRHHIQHRFPTIKDFHIPTKDFLSTMMVSHTMEDTTQGQLRIPLQQLRVSSRSDFFARTLSGFKAVGTFIHTPVQDSSVQEMGCSTEINTAFTVAMEMSFMWCIVPQAAWTCPSPIIKDHKTHRKTTSVQLIWWAVGSRAASHTEGRSGLGKWGCHIISKSAIVCSITKHQTWERKVEKKT